jgi:hypothetical protein
MGRTKIIKEEGRGGEGLHRVQTGGPRSLSTVGVGSSGSNNRTIRVSCAIQCLSSHGVHSERFVESEQLGSYNASERKDGRKSGRESRMSYGRNGMESDPGTGPDRTEELFVYRSFYF